MRKFTKDDYWIDRLMHNITDKEKFKMEFGTWMKHRAGIRQAIAGDFGALTLPELKAKYEKHIR